MLEIKNLNKSFKKKQVLRDFTYTFENGVYGLLGPNGAGKTTLIRLITRLYPDRADAIRFNGRPIRKDADYLSHIGYLPQKFGMYRELTAREMLAMLANLKDADRGGLREKIDQALALVNLADRADSKVKTLSGGMVRRLGIAQAILGDPQILIFDEPTAGLDPEERLRFKNMIARLRGDRIILISTHIVEDVEAVCDRVAIMKDGKVAVSGTCTQIAELAEGKVYTLPESESNRLTGNYTVQKHYEKDGVRMLKILSGKEQPFDRMPANVEDGYICVLENI